MTVRVPADPAEGPPARHPLQVATLRGHSAAERAFLDAYRSGRLHHAWLIGGPAGVGKSTLAWHIARFLLSHPSAETDVVRAAHTLAAAADPGVTARLLAGSHGDVAVLERQWNDKTKRRFSEIRVDDVRDALGMFRRAAGSGGYRICIIDSAEDLNRSSANALLKAIEEPPPRSVFLIVAHRPGQVLPTLVSRSRRLLLSGLAETDIRAALRDLMPDTADADHLDSAAARAQGSLGEALRLLAGEASDLDAATEALLVRLPAVDWRGVHRLADAIGNADDRLATSLQAIYRWLETQLHRRAGARPAVLARYADAWGSIRAAAREAEVLNLDKRSLLLSVFADLARAAG